MVEAKTHVDNGDGEKDSSARAESSHEIGAHSAIGKRQTRLASEY